jgi:hypothetical protein
MNTTLFREIARHGTTGYYLQLSIWSYGSHLAYIRYAPGSMTASNDRLNFPQASFTHPGSPTSAWGVSKLRIEVTRTLAQVPTDNGNYQAYNSGANILVEIPIIRNVGTDQRLDFNSIYIEHGSLGLGQVIQNGGTSAALPWYYVARTTGNPGNALVANQYKYGNNTANATVQNTIQFNGAGENSSLANSTLITFDNTGGSSVTIDKIDVRYNVLGTQPTTAGDSNPAIGNAMLNPARAVPADATLNVNSMTFTIQAGPIFLNTVLSIDQPATFEDFLGVGNAGTVEFWSGATLVASTASPIVFEDANALYLQNIGSQDVPALSTNTINLIRLTSGTAIATSNPDFNVNEAQVIKITADSIRIMK